MSPHLLFFIYFLKLTGPHKPLLIYRYLLDLIRQWHQPGPFLVWHYQGNLNRLSFLVSSSHSKTRGELKESKRSPPVVVCLKPKRDKTKGHTIVMDFSFSQFLSKFEFRMPLSVIHNRHLKTEQNGNMGMIPKL